MLTIPAAARLIGVSVPTMRRYDAKGLLKPTRTLGNHRRYHLHDLEPWLREKDLPPDAPDIHPHKHGRPYGYARVSGFNQAIDGNLDRQADRLERFLKAKFGPQSHPMVIKEYGSGLNPNRPGLWRLIHKVKAGEVSSLVVVYEDRLSRFGVPFLKEIFNIYGVPLLLEEELVNDLMALMVCFSGRLYKSRALRQSAGDRAAHKEARCISTFIEKSVARAEWGVIRQIIAIN
jgi:predicted site-specific integrase-resolvase